MDSLLASYASSDEEEDNHSSLSLPPPKPIPSPSSSLLCSLPPPNPSILHQHHHGDDDEEPESNTPQFPRPNSPAHEPPPNPTFAPTKPPSFFSSLPPPKSNPDPDPNPNPTPTISSPVPPPKRVVQFQLPINPNLAAHKDDDESHDEDDDADEEPKRPTKMGSQSSLGPSSVMSFLSSIPAPKNTKMALGALPSSGSGRRSVLEASGFNEVKSEDEASRAGVDAEFGDHEINWTDATPPVVSGSDGGIVGAASIEVNHSSWVPGNQNYDHYDSYGSYGGSESNWANGSSTMAMTPESYAVGMIENVVKVPGKRGRNEIPTTIVEVKQDELIKNRPREDQSKLTGVAFGPSYQPVSAKGKPSKLHKRKHQIGSLFFDMKQKETELAERRSRGFLTKAETQAKYGW